MKVIIQRVLAAKVTVASEVISSIGPGLCVLVGISREDTAKDVDFIAKKLLAIRLFDGPDDDAAARTRWKHSVQDANAELLCVSQFTLCCRLKGNKPDFHQAMGEREALHLYELLLQKLRDSYRADRVRTGQFGAKMVVHIENDGPVTIEVESPRVASVEGSLRTTGGEMSEASRVAVVQPLPQQPQPAQPQPPQPSQPFHGNVRRVVR